MCVICRSTLTKISPKAKRPITTATKFTPAMSVEEPNVSRVVPVNGSIPTKLTKRPSAIPANPLRRAFSDRLTTRLSAMNMRAKYSGGPKASATPARIGAKKVTPTRLRVPATKEPMAAMPNAGPALPCFANS